ncbi:putative fatty acyl-CoA reductase CG5065 [Manduca sexta]|uniref:Fatty acyl-CoA reductase n=1 Tax=Manduca sexta TaxID=7130 RepID=A0A922CQJ2_MANSE|nr:putative fatty acyl-CoA reductase CG5065 [Manduca sexta]KAG6454596.1 hypothetical protein O3G_MSEX008770 [Manduca sexta]
MGFLEDRDLTHIPGIPEFYKGKSIFITGGTGFLGKVLIEKLLYSCTNLNKLYLLLRKKKGMTTEERLKKLYSITCFDRLRKERPGVFESKVVALSGDVEEDGLGLSPADRNTLVNNVNIVFHSAASVKFDDHLAYAVKLNLIGTLQMINLAKEMKHICAFIHISTTYSNSNKNPVEEVLYPPHADWRDLIEVCQNIDHHTIEIMTPKYLGDIPNTYTFTKQLAEHVVDEAREVLPAVIVRPSIVISSVSDPSPGWIDNFNGPVGLYVGFGKGILKSVYSKKDLISDYIPVDICVKNLITVAWIRGTKEFEPTDPVQIYNCCSIDEVKLTLEEVVSKGIDILETYPLSGMIWNYGMTITTCWPLHYTLVIFKHLVPAIMIDCLLRLLGKKPLLFKIQRRIYRSNLALMYFCTRNWIFENKNSVTLNSCIKEKDKENFDYNLSNINVDQYYVDSIRGGKRFLLKEKDENIMNDRLHSKRMWWLDKILTSLFYCYLAWSLFNYVCKYYYQ